MNKRAVIIVTAIVFGFLLVVLRLADLMLVNHERLAARAKDQYEGRQDLHVGRGRILDRRGRELAVSLEAMSVYVNPFELDSREEAARLLSGVTGEKYGVLLKKMSLGKNFIWVKRKLDFEAAEGLGELGLKGVGVLPEVRRFYPKGSLASHVVGFVGIDNQPLEGVELVYDRSLRGWEGTVSVAKDAGGRTLSAGFDLGAGGDNVVLTLDEGLQYIVEGALEKAMDRWDASSASAILMDPFTGEVLAMANRPTYDLNDPSAYRASHRRNRAITDTYEPGSTFKLITAAAVLEEGVVGVNTVFDMRAGYIRVGGKAIWDTRNHGVATFAEVIRASSNVGAVMAGRMLSREVFQRYIKAFGFGRRSGIDLAGETPGKAKPTREWSATTQAAVSIGYEVAVTPLQLLRAYCAVANGGMLVTPHVVSRIVSPGGDIIYRFQPRKPERAISRRTTNILKEILVSVTEDGTARGAMVAGNRVAGKTGTTRLLDPETGFYSRERYAGSFVGFVPADNPRVALVVVIFEPRGGYYGGHVAAPVFREIAERTLAYLNVPREDNFRENVLVVRRAGVE